MAGGRRKLSDATPADFPLLFAHFSVVRYLGRGNFATV